MKKDVVIQITNSKRETKLIAASEQRY